MKHVFVSSTFKDMQFERDALHTVAAIGINERLAPYGEEVYFGDLRWGVNTTSLDSEEGCRRVLEVCLDEIDDCRPYMIVLVGERYGWIPGGDAIRGAALAKGVEIDDGVSVTQLEIEYGALLNGERGGRIFFYFRELDTDGMSEQQLADYTAESELHRQKIDALKAKIRAIYPDAVRTYTARFDAKEGSVVGLEGFLEAVTADLSGAFEADLAQEERLPWQERAIRSAERYYLELAKNYYDAAREPNSLFDGTFAGEEPVVSFVRGESGVGKSTFLAHEYERHLLTGELLEALPFVLGLDKYSTCEADYFKILLYRLEKLCGEEHLETLFGEDECDGRIFDRIRRLEPKAPLKLHSVIDNCSYELQNELSVRLLDLYLAEGDVTYLGKDTHPCKNLDFLIAYSADDKAVILPPCFDFSRTFVLADLSEEDQVPFVQMLLRRKHKELDSSVIAAITEKEQAASPFYLKLAVDRMLMLDSRDFSEIRAMGDGMENINRYQLELVKRLPDTSTELSGELIRCVANRVGHEFTLRLLGVLTYGGVRMTESFIESVFSTRGWEYSSLGFARATRSLSAVISYNPKDKSYAIKNRDAISAAEAMLDREGFRYVAMELWRHVAEEATVSDIIFRAAAYAGADALAEIYVRAKENKKYLIRQTDWLVCRFGAKLAAQALLGAAAKCPDFDFSFIVSAIPTSCLTIENNESYEEFLQIILDKTEIKNGFLSQINLNSLAVLAWCKLVSIKMRVNASDASATFHGFIDAGYRTALMLPRARIMLDCTYYRYLALEAFHSMKIIESPESEPACAYLLGEILDSEEGVLLSSHLYGAFAAYLRRAYDPEHEEYGELARRGYELLGEALTEGELKSVYADDVAMMIDCLTDNSDDMLRADTDGVGRALEFLAAGQRYVNSALLKYLPRILYAAKYSLDTDEDDFSDETVNLLRRLCAASRAVAGSAVTVADMLYAVVQMDQCYDILSDRLTADEHLALVTHLHKFVGILLGFAGEDPRVLYRCYMPLRRLLTVFEIYGMDRAKGGLLARLSELEAEDADAPIFPELLIGSLIYRFGAQDNDELRDRLRELAETVEGDEAYCSYASAYAPELMYLKLDIRTEEEIEADDERFQISFSDGEDIDFDDEDLRDEIYDDDDDDEYSLDDDDDEYSLDDDDDGEFDLDCDGEENVTEFSEEEINDMLNFLKNSGLTLEDLLGDDDEE